MLVSDPQTFESAALLAERMAGAYFKAAHSGPTPMDLGAIDSNGIGNSKSPGIGSSIGNCGCTQGTQSNCYQSTTMC